MNSSRLWAIAAFVVFGAACLVVGCWLRVIDSPEWMLPDTTQHPPAMRPWAVEADCYSQLARVQRILHGRGLIQNHFTVENWPEGLAPSTTAPFDYVILLLYAPLCLFTRHPLDWAGALVSPALWVGLVLFWMLFRSREFKLTGRSLLLLGSAALPAFTWAMACGRPRHQSLILVLMAMGFTAEYERWQIELTPKRAWNIFAGIVWGLACWTSLFEPAVVVGVLILFNLIARRRENIAFLASFGIVVLAMVLVEGGHIFTNLSNIYNLTPEYRQYALNWLGTIAEVRPVDFDAMVHRMTLVFLTLPFVAWGLWPRKNGNKTDALLILLTLLLVVLTALQVRWIYYASLGELFLIVRFFQVAPVRWTRLVVLVIFLAGLADAAYEQVEASAHAPVNQPSLQLAEISRAIDGPGGIMAPWWLSPGLLYFSGQPIVSGSSHCGISGIVASAKFFAADSWADAEQILKERKVRWIVIWDDESYEIVGRDNEDYEYPLLNASRGILGLPYIGDENKRDADSTVAQVLISDENLPTSFRLRGVTPQLKLYEYVPEGQ
ncbi:MAG: hypothetical protein LV480_09495 [Methylacidiphilales bacterium]|nr:hypothetical protein [Candidatus Methylacidiphilales bacterium]